MENFTTNYPPILDQLKKTYKIWLPILKNFPKPEQFGIGTKIDRDFLDLLEILRLAAFSSINEKRSLIEKSLKLIDAIRFFLQLCWELKLISTKQFALLGNEIEIVGKMAGGWGKDCQQKTSQ
ncbi:MAG: four helix bundle protein [Candidatus Berkelbacteria bacterium]|nr:four helix bundle protein [Candidatus Berkelbacteria bacterium]